ncbi:MAG TPA: ATP-binding protein [Candidatus Deferrimicrobium sp.]|nr:ATP-binding protein [Candidatus Deferrimicrobium sp.]
MSTFREKLFRLFLLFAVIPAVLLGVTGYYLAVESISLSPPQPADDARALAAYYNDLLFERIADCLASPLSDTANAPELLDFAFEYSSGKAKFLIGDPQLPPPLSTEIETAAATRSRGFVQCQGGIYQYVCREMPDGASLCGGVRHDSSYVRLLSSFQSGYVSRLWTGELRTRYLIFLTVVFVVVTLLTAGLAWLFSARFAAHLSRPLLALGEGAKRISAGDFKHSVPLSGTNEMQTLITDFNRMAEQLLKTTDRLAQSERVAAWRHVARQFAHELKNPLQPLLISIYRMRRLLESRADSVQVKEALQAASEEVTHLSALAERFADLSKLPPPTLSRVNLSEALRSLAHLYRDHLAPYSFELRLPTEDVWADVDEPYLREALHNLLQNAADASEKSGKILLELRRCRDSVEIIVEDHGRGMTEQVLASSRLPYFSTKAKGSGLGLAIAEKTVSELGGQLSITSQPGMGTTVIISLPCRD